MAKLTDQVVIATRNAGKLKEFADMFGTLGIQVKSLADYPEMPDVIEDRDTFAGNALKKAQEMADQLGLPVLADDSGLCVDALGGAPGVYSARYAGEPANDAANNAKLLRELAALVAPLQLPAAAGGGTVAEDSRQATDAAVAGVAPIAAGLMQEGGLTLEQAQAHPPVYSAARFVSVLVLYNPADGSTLSVEGTCSGYILTAPRGEAGFGYDPLFYMPEYGQTLAEMTLTEKNRVSHRAHALQKLVAQLQTR
jgi:XTP/dITP diphosphohydrolase